MTARKLGFCVIWGQAVIRRGAAPGGGVGEKGHAVRVPRWGVEGRAVSTRQRKPSPDDIVTRGGLTRREVELARERLHERDTHERGDKVHELLRKDHDLEL